MAQCRKAFWGSLHAEENALIKQRSAVRTLHALLGLGVSLVVISTAGAQAEHETEVPARETAAQRRAQETAATAKALVTDEVTYEQVLADPDNIDLNFRYAKTQIARGDLRGAAATLERLLLINPKLVRIRLLYGIVLFRLDNTDEAERTLKTVLEEDVPASLRAEVEEYLEHIRLRRKTTRWLATVATGWQFNTNRNAAPSSKTRLLVDTPLALTGTNRKRRDTSVIAIKSLQVVHDLRMQAGHQLYGTFTHYLGEQTTVDSLDLESYNVEGGVILKAGQTTITPSAFAEHILLSRETYLRTQGGSLQIERPVSQRLRLSGGLRRADEEYVGITENAAAPERRGPSTAVVIGGSYTLTPTMLVTLTGSYTSKNATRPYYAYDGLETQVSHTWLLGKGQFFTTSYSFEVDGYDEPDAAISVRRRRDEQHRTRITYGAPVALFLGQRFLPRWVLKDLLMTLTLEHFRSDSNIRNYTYTDSKVAAMLTKSFEF